MELLENGATAAEAASAANSFSGIRIMTGGPTIGAAVGGSFDVYVVTVDNNGTITVTPASGGLAVLPPGQKGAIIHLRNTHGNPQYGTAERRIAYMQQNATHHQTYESLRLEKTPTICFSPFTSSGFC